jgi:hypothetical protein
MLRARRLAFALVLAAAAVPVATLARPAVALADERPIEVGTELMATSDVTLHKAEIAKGSRVSVTQLSRRAGLVESVNVELADGHVVKVSIAQVHTFFSVVGE